MSGAKSLRVGLAVEGQSFSSAGHFELEAYVSSLTLLIPLQVV